VNLRPVALTTKRLTLSPLGAEHAAALFVALRDPEIYRYLPADPPRNIGALEARYRHTSAGPPKPDERWWNWAVALREEGALPIGTVEVTLREHGATALLAYVFGRDAWGRGIANEACAAAIAHLHERARTREIDAYIDTRNARSIRLAERLGMQRIETVVEADHFKGSASDEYHYRLVAKRREG
jgi:RimJ/RimL family protein N-acetyltransferase